MADELMDYWFDLKEEGDTRTCVAYAVNGAEVDRRDNGGDAGVSFTDLMTACMPKIQEDIEMYGVAS